MNNIILPNGRPSVREEAGRHGTERMVAKPILVCDLDGTLRYNKDDPDGFINEPEEIAFFDGVLDAVWAYRDNGWLPVVVSNQGGVAHGYMGKKDLDRQMNRMAELARQETDHNRGWPFLDTRFCMYHEKGDDEMYGYRSLHRKPMYGALGSIEQRAKVNGIIPKWDQSVVIGDRPEDEAMAQAAGLDYWPAEEWRAELKAQRGGGSDE